MSFPFGGERYGITATSGVRMAVMQVYAALGVVQIEERASWQLLDPKEPVIPAKSETVRVRILSR